MKKRILFNILSFFIMLFVLTGCWDNVSIEEQGYAVGVALDVVKKRDNGDYLLELTDQFIIPAGIGPATQQGGSDGKAFENVSSKGVSVTTMNRNLASRVSRTPYYGHLKVLVVSEKMAKTDNLFASILDAFNRNREVRRSVKVLISKENARDILNTKVETEVYPVKFIDSMVGNVYKTIDAIHPVRLGRIHSDLVSRTSYVVPMIEKFKGSLSYGRVAVFNGYDNKMVGSLTKEETKGFNLLTANHDGGALEFDIDNQVMVIEVKNVDTKIHLTGTTPETLKANIDITVEGGLAEMFGQKGLQNHKYVEQIERQIQKRIHTLAEKTFKKLQKNYKTDVIGIREKLKRHDYDMWKQVSDDWERGENYFSKMDIDIDTHAVVRNIGVIDKGKGKGLKK